MWNYLYNRQPTQVLKLSVDRFWFECNDFFSFAANSSFSLKLKTLLIALKSSINYQKAKMSGEQEEIVDVDDLVRKMITSEMPAFAKDFIEEKFKQVIEGFKQESSIDASESKSAKFQEEMKEVQKEIEVSWHL